MSGNDKPRRSYPPFWEKFIPYILGLIGLIVLGLVLLALSVVLGVYPFG